MGKNFISHHFLSHAVLESFKLGKGINIIFRTVALWDSRKLNKKKSQAVQEIDAHKRVIESAYFSPVSGDKIVSTSTDDTIKSVKLY